MPSGWTPLRIFGRVPVQIDFRGVGFSLGFRIARLGLRDQVRGVRLGLLG